jgi:O-methyltransferase involved in polyketide biosynthesis
MKGVKKTAQEAIDCKRAANGGSVIAKTPLLNRVYQARGSLMLKAVKSALDSSDIDHKQLLILGAGLDTTYDLLAGCTFLVDYSEVLDRRTASLPHVVHVPADLSNSKALFASLLSSGFSCSAYTVILIECVLSYVDSGPSSDLLSALVKALPSSAVIAYDPVLPYGNNTDGFAEQMNRKFSEREAPLRSCSQNLHQYAARFTNAGYANITATSINQALQLYLSHEERKSTTDEPFDEFSSLAVLHSHYAMCIASREKDIFQRLQKTLTAHQTSGLEERCRVLACRVASAELRLQDLVRRRTQAKSSSERSFL